MYHIAYKDPMTGFILEAQAAVLSEVVEAIEKAKHELYHKNIAPGSNIDPGYSSKEGAAAQTQEEASKKDQESAKAALKEDVEENTPDEVEYFSEEFLDLEDFWYP